MFNEINRSVVEMKMKELRNYALQANLATIKKKNRKKSKTDNKYYFIPFLRPKKAS